MAIEDTWIHYNVRLINIILLNDLLQSKSGLWQLEYGWNDKYKRIY